MGESFIANVIKDNRVTIPKNVINHVKIEEGDRIKLIIQWFEKTEKTIQFRNKKKTKGRAK
jgi:bifunctional DNA-binding transcriptional regulator/antitoxin component of YhaV-PrlF toxin-antitoxin module